MKTLIFAMFILCSVNLNGQNTIRNMTQWNLNVFTEKCIRELCIDSCIITIQPVNGLIYGKYQAISFGSNKNYTIGISSTMYFEESLNAIAHELVHISQLSNNRLKILDSRHIIFNNKKYRTDEYTHIDDLQEKEAFDISKRLCNIIKIY